MTALLSVIEVFRLEPLPGEKPRSRVVAGGAATATVIEGVVLEAQFRSTQGFLLLTSDDTPFEEVLHVRLLDAQFRVLDGVDLGQAYHPGLLRNLRVSGDAELCFSFFGDDCWLLRVEPQARVRWGLRPYASVRYTGPLLRGHNLHLFKSKPAAGS
jgi:hypothetical protein